MQYTVNYTTMGNDTYCVQGDACFCLPWFDSLGTQSEKTAANALQWTAFGISVAMLIFYAYETWKATTGWEEVYVCGVEMVKVIIEFFHEFDSPAMLYLSSGERVLWIRYAEWLLTCPVILIPLSNLTGLKDDYNKRTMRLLVSDIGTIVMGATSAMCTGNWLKILFFCLGLLYASNTFFHAAKIYIESYHIVPKGTCRMLVRLMAWIFFASWACFPLLFVLGPEGFGHISWYASTIGHTIIDLMSKNLWGMLGHFLRVQIHKHILLYGDIRKKVMVNVAGEQMEVETMVEE
nr:protein 116 [synthetic construct]